ncbi:cell division protein SepF [Marininema halotolerans]|uniref:Cell division protein SepF n=1 Tax=Marininema halotolerans TaxID=1155944 RepID=A0A1I6QCT7_9BACL|nr:cell division protein SepF [Marininema halotolerans]SFS50222.1 cell division inhibitor SepF [Marininema halotolerans]
MNFKDRVMGFFGINEDEEYEEGEAPDIEPPPLSRNRKNVVSLHSQKNVRVVLAEPRMYEDAQEIADNLKNHRPTVVNLQRVPKDQAVRIVDFLSGTVYALGGNIQKLGTHIFFCTPANVDIQGTISTIFPDEANDILR